MTPLNSGLLMVSSLWTILCRADVHSHTLAREERAWRRSACPARASPDSLVEIPAIGSATLGRPRHVVAGQRGRDGADGRSRSILWGNGAFVPVNSASITDCLTTPRRPGLHVAGWFVSPAGERST